ncbi:MAG TPA: adenine phosphoribosyltransferase [Candidatus Binatia bacterium]|jgi:adenine phosphoribosyltransferase|nr:adenine phosphoribosyltransferase [Candidatus Binatia bacterium]
MEKEIAEIRKAIRDIPNFPKPGIIFKDITPLLSQGKLFRKTIDLLGDRYRSQAIDIVLGIESRGFIVGSALAYRLGAGFCIVRKPGKLPHETHRATYDLEYGSDSLEVHRDALHANARVLIVDDLLATGGTASAAAQLVERLGGKVVECAFVIELSFLRGRARLAPHSVFSLVQYETE